MNRPSDTLEELLENSSLARDLVPGKFKFTSQQGRARRMQLLTAAKELLCKRQPEEVSFADVCERAGIPRASAYHFFPNIQSIFLGLRVLHAEAMVDAILAVGNRRIGSWRDYFSLLVDVGARVMRAD